MMKFLCAIAVLLLSGCATRHITIPPITLPPVHVEITGTEAGDKSGQKTLAGKFLKQMLGPESIAFQIAIGCESYRRLAGRWPRTQEEMGEGLAVDKLPADRLADLQQVTLRETGDSLKVEFTAGGKIPMRGQVSIHAPKSETVIQPEGSGKRGGATDAAI